jgi:hypothetical protein
MLKRVCLSARQQQALEPEEFQQPETGSLGFQVDGVSMSDVMESTIGALATLSAASMVFRDSIDDLGVRPLLKKLLEEAQLEVDVETAARGAIHQYFYNFSIFFLSFF